MRAFPVPGDVFGNYVIERELGRGAMGIVYLARQPSLERRVALKLLSPVLDEPSFRRRFEREARTLAKLQSPYVVAVHDFGEHDGWLYLTNPYLSDGDLQARIDVRPFDPGTALRLLGQLATGLSAAHQAGIIHRDIKPSNILLAEDPDGLRLLLSDFGIAREMSAGVLTTTAVAVGTLPYMPPERHEGSDASPAGDVYALGCVLWAMLHGRPPFLNDKGILQLKDVFTAPPPAFVGPLAHHVNGILLRCLAKDPEDRFTDALQLRAALAAGREAVENRHRDGADGKAADEREADGGGGRGPDEADRRIEPARTTVIGPPERGSTGTDERPSKRPRRIAMLVGGVAIGALVLGGIGLLVATTGDWPDDARASDFCEVLDKQDGRVWDDSDRTIEGVREGMGAIAEVGTPSDAPDGLRAFLMDLEKAADEASDVEEFDRRAEELEPSDAEDDEWEAWIDDTCS
ncbi:serine/threonine-protein kinase [Nocardioides bizhenqiangii]|uniref:non-specific serine/threonine protein kinase n=1 Tax=Nocardioides bizhenqiangii TaxID=3095076 RepID=A0ABZ0ZV10_9ACTN|nr:serine/threonine-protein kinase [Nocardioides sp. HM61]WQQ27754.1 serine/threonine-protein kinase [Nocardioides sp. HM61]